MRSNILTILVPKDPCLALLKLNPRSSVTRLPQHRSFDHVAYISCQSSLNRVKHSKFIYIFIFTSIHSGGYAKYFNRNQLEIQISYTKCSRMPRKKNFEIIQPSRWRWNAEDCPKAESSRALVRFNRQDRPYRAGELLYELLEETQMTARSENRRRNVDAAGPPLFIEKTEPTEAEEEGDRVARRR